MRILYIAPLTSIHAQRWIGFFRDRGHEVHVLVFSADQTHPISGITYHHLIPLVKRLPLPLDWILAKLPFFARLRDEVNALAPDIVHVHWIDFFAYALARTGFHPFVLTAWGSDILLKTKESAKVRFAVRAALQKADRVTCDAEHMRDALIKWGAPADKVSVINFGTDCRKFTPQRRDERLSEELGFGAGTRLVLSLRQLRPIYDIPTFIRAMPLIGAECPEARFIIGSDGPDRDALEQQVAEAGLGDVTKFTGYLSEDDLVRYTASADVYVSSALSDAGLAASTAEAMACGVPAVVTDFGNNREWVKDGETGFLFPCRDHDQLAEKVLRLLRNPELGRDLGQHGRQLIAEKNNWEREMLKVEDLYRAASAALEHEKPCD